MSKIVISYRRSFYDAIAGRIRDKLVSHYGDDAVYMDVDNIPFGIDFRDHINQALSEGDVVVAIIGPKWHGPIKGRKARIFDETDPVRVEIETALKRGIAVVPILVDGAKMPKPDSMPESIGKLAYHNAATVDAGVDFHQHMDRVIRSMNMVVKVPSRQEKAAARDTSSGGGRLKWVAGAAAATVVLTIGIFAALPLFGPNNTPAPETRAVETAAPQQKAATAPVRTEPARPVTSIAAGMGTRVALVIGNASYARAATLKNTVNDAVAVSDVFRSMGFSVITRTNIGRQEFVNALRAFQDEANKAQIAVVYYAGHALEMQGTNYLIPTDAKIERDADVADESISLDRLFAAIEGAQRLRLILLDACRDNPFASQLLSGGGRSLALAPALTRGATVAAPAERGLARIDSTPPNTLIAYAAKAGDVALDGEGDHSPFATALIKHLTTPDVDIRIVLGKVRDEVLRITSNRQEPFVYGSLSGETISLAATAK
jgi:hypothetical protein